MKFAAFIISLALFAGAAFGIARHADLSLPFGSVSSVTSDSEEAPSSEAAFPSKTELPPVLTVPSNAEQQPAVAAKPVSKPGSSSVESSAKSTPLKQPIEKKPTKPTGQTSGVAPKPESKSASNETSVRALAADKMPAPQVVAPPPLKVVTGGETGAVLSASGVVSFTNQHRALSGLAPLTINSSLTTMAAVKAQDMLDKGYFAHVSPTGVGVSDLARQVGYVYLMVGENLALGNFGSDSALVQGWMNSPGHRANILKPQFTEIGVAVLSGIYQGQRVWYAVQEFGLPRSACSFPDETLKAQIVTKEAAIDDKFGALQVKQQELERLAQTNVPEYNSRAPIYNEMVNVYNALVAEVKELVEKYNGQIRALNECMQNTG